jgi:membrane protein implicated in regulation of membrane protease activity
MIDPLGTLPGYQNSGTSASNGLATAALTCGIIGTLIAWIPFLVVIGIALGVLALVFGIKGLRRSRSVGRGRGPAIAGIATGTSALLLAIIGVILSVVVFRAVADFAEPGPHDANVASCTLDGRIATVNGTLTNESGTVRDYSLFVTVDKDVDVFTIDAVAPGETVQWSATIRNRAAPDECRATVVVQGPFPFGIEMDPIES